MARERVEKRKKRCKIPRPITIIAMRLNMSFQPNKGSSLYRIPNKKIVGQEDWDSPFGTLRLSNHWCYENWREERVYITDIMLPKRVWALAVNTGKIECPWKVLEIFTLDEHANVIRKIDFEKINREIKQILKSVK